MQLPPDLASLSFAEKDALILALLARVATLEAENTALRAKLDLPPKRCALMRTEQSVSPPRRNQLAGSTAFHGRSGRSYLAENARRGNYDLTTVGHPENVRINGNFQQAA
jgi:hypothetical protein